MKKNTTDGIFTARQNITSAVLVRLSQLGVDTEHADRLLKDDGYAERVAAAMRYGKDGSIYQVSAQKIMLENFFGLNDWEHFFGLKLTKEQLLSIAEFPWNEKVLYSRDPFTPGKTVRETHLAWLGMEEIKCKPLTMRVWDGLAYGKIEAPHDFGKVNVRFWGDDPDFKREYDMEFAETTTCEFRWYLTPIVFPRKFMQRDFLTQRKMIPPGYRMGSAIEEFTKNALYTIKHRFMKGSTHEDWFNKGKFVRVADVQPGAGHVSIGNYLPDYLVVGRDEDDKTPGNLGMSVTRL